MKKVSLIFAVVFSFVFASCNKDSCGFSLVNLILSINASQAQIQAGQTMDVYSALSNVAQYCSSNPIGESAPPSEEELIVEKHDGYQYVRVGSKSIQHGSINDGSTSQSITPITFNQAGLYRIHSTADAPNSIAEYNENDNSAGLIIGRVSQNHNVIEVSPNDNLSPDLPAIVFGESISIVK